MAIILTYQSTFNEVGWSLRDTLVEIEKRVKQSN